MKESPATGKQTFAFAKSDEAFKALAEHEDPQVQALVAARLGTKSRWRRPARSVLSTLPSEALPVPGTTRLTQAVGRG